MVAKQLTVGSRAQVLHGTAKKTSGGLVKKDLSKNDQGKIVSKKASAAAKKNKNLGGNLGRLRNNTIRKSVVSKQKKTSRRKR
jgi:hypothetical protein